MNADALIHAVQDRFGSAVTGSHEFRGDATVLISRDSLLAVARTLKEDRAFADELSHGPDGSGLFCFWEDPVAGLLCLVRSGGESAA